MIDVDQRTLFSLQAVINDSVMVIPQMMIIPYDFDIGCWWFFSNLNLQVLGEESKPLPLFDESLVRIGPPADIEVQQVRLLKSQF